MLLFAAIEQETGVATSPWSDQEFRNWADKTDGIVSTVGLLAAAVAPLITKDNDRTWMGVGVGVAGLGRLVGNLFGQQTGSRFESKVAYVDYTRRAYDDMRSRNSITVDYVRSNEALRRDLQVFLNTTYGDAARETDPAKRKEKMAGVLSTASSFLTRFDIVLTQIPAMVRLYEETITKYCPDALRMASSSEQNIGAARCQIQPANAREPIALVGDSKIFLLRAAEHIRQLQNSLEAADRIRHLTPEVRAALNGQ